ncbi:MAG: DNA repair protein RadA [Calditrichaeota bacterium]|nr:MAG: DNA repair protein RadA [Calditrichota bacterium]
MNKKKEKIQFVCQSCGYVSIKWLGRCTECSAWNSFVEETVFPKKSGRTASLNRHKSEPVSLNEITSLEDERISFQSAEFNRVLGEGLVKGSLVLIGGDPGIGKSTLLLQEAAHIAEEKFQVLYVSGEESNQQTKLRASRLELNSAHLLLLAETNLEEILHAAEKTKPQLIIVDSVQTIYQPAMESAPGSISQVRECALRFLEFAKSKNVPVILVGHVTKEGYLAGPKVLEHMVDTLLQFEGDRQQFFRILRAVKNRFGSTREIGIFEMNETGMVDVSNPSEIFLSQRSSEASGSAVVCAIEGTRPILVEVQALVTTTNYGTPQRTATGFDSKRLALLLAVLEKRIGLRLGMFDVFLNVAGGVRLDEPAVDLGIVIAIASSMKNSTVPQEMAFIGEVGLTGEVRFVPQLEQRINEAAKLGFKKAVVPNLSGKKIAIPKNFKLIETTRLDDLFDKLF